MKLEEFTTFLDEQGFNWEESGKSIVLQDCPECGTSGYKVRLRVVDVDEDQPFFGRCQRASCGKGFSSVSWSIKMGVPYDEVMGAHGLDPEKNLGGIVPPDTTDMPTNLDMAPKVAAAEKPDLIIDVSYLKTVDSWLDHPVAEYAKKRGYVPEFSDIVQMDTKAGAVVFVVRNEKGEAVGYQRRYLYPRNPKMKTQSSDDFKASDWILVFHKPGANIAICEGPFTALSAWHYGYTGVCTFGANVGDKQIKAAVKLALREGVGVGVSFDEDPAGKKGFNRIACYMHWADIPIFKLKPESGNDLNDSWMAGTGVKITENVEINPAIPDIQAFF